MRATKKRVLLHMIAINLLSRDHLCGNMAFFIRDSRYFGPCLRNKNATRGTDGKGEPTSIGQARRRLVDPFTQDGQIAIERAIIERTQFNLHLMSMVRDR